MFTHIDSRTRQDNQRTMAGAGSSSSSSSSFIDVGANLLDDMFQGEYNGSQKHPPDLEHVLARAWDAGLTHIIITAGNLDEARRALELAGSDRRLFSTVGVHPTRCGEFAKNDEGGAEPYLDALMELARDGQKTGKVVAIGECGLDYDRLHFCDKPEQMEGFERQFVLAKETGLPMFLHNRNTGNDFVEMLHKHRHEFSQGVVHSFTGPAEEAQAILGEEGVYIGLNGCSFKTEEQVEVIKSSIPLERILLETDAPWCEIRTTHAGARFLSQGEKDRWGVVKKEKWQPDKFVKGRQESAHIRLVAEAVAGILEVPVEAVAAQCHANTLACFPGLTGAAAAAEGKEEAAADP